MSTSMVVERLKKTPDTCLETINNYTRLGNKINASNTKSATDIKIKLERVQNELFIGIKTFSLYKRNKFSDQGSSYKNL